MALKHVAGMRRSGLWLALAAAWALAGCSDGAAGDPPPKPATPVYYRARNGVIWTNYEDVRTSADLDTRFSMEMAGMGKAEGSHPALASFSCPVEMADEACARAWRAQELANARAEFLALRPFEDAIFEAVSTGDPYKGLDLIRRTTATPVAVSTLPRHEHERRSALWKARAVPFDCWNATYKLRGMIAEEGSPNRDRMRGDAADASAGAESIEASFNELLPEYVKSARRCEDLMGLDHPQSRLRAGSVHVHNIVGGLSPGQEPSSDLTPISGLPDDSAEPG